MTAGVPSLHNANQWLAILRRGTSQYDLYRRLFLKELDDCGLTLKAARTSKEELHDLVVKACKLKANQLLDALRDGVDVPEVYVRYLWEEFAKGGLAPEDIYTTSVEIEGFLLPRV